MASETLLHLGSRSFSHFLNATERYLDVLRYLTPDSPARRTLLDGVSSYWRQSSQMRLVTVDKYLQYGVLEGLDVVSWIFAEQGGGAGGDDGDGWTDGDKWEMLRMCLDKHVGKVAGARRRVRLVEKEDEAARARRAAEKLERGEGVELEKGDGVKQEGAEGVKLEMVDGVDEEEDIKPERELTRISLMTKLNWQQRISSSGRKKLGTLRHSLISTHPSSRRS